MHMHYNTSHSYQENAEESPSSLTSASCRPALILLTRTGISRDGYEGRISVNERHVTLRTVTGADEGSYTVRDAVGDIQRKMCLNVIGERTNEDRSCSFPSSMLDLF